MKGILNRNKMLIFFLIGLIITSPGISRAESGPSLGNRGLLLKEGVYSDEVRLLKDFFRVRNPEDNLWGYYYDRATKDLVKKYQEEVGLDPSCQVDKATLKKINDEIESSYILGLRRPEISHKGDLILVNKSSNTVYLMREGKILKTYPAATGKSSQLTPDGKHKLVVKYKDPYWGGAGVSEPIKGGDPKNPLGTRWMGISYKGGNKYGLHGNSNPGSIGKKVSLGCIRLFKKDIEELYDLVGINTPVWIGSEDLLASYGVKFTSPKMEVKGEKVNIVLNGKKVDLDQKIINKNSTNYYPFRAVLEMAGAKVYWNEVNQTAYGEYKGRTVEFKRDSKTYLVDGQERNLAPGQKTFIYKERTYVPIRQVMEALNFRVDWQGENSTIIIDENPDYIGQDPVWDKAYGQDEAMELLRTSMGLRSVRLDPSRENLLRSKEVLYPVILEISSYGDTSIDNLYLGNTSLNLYDKDFNIIRSYNNSL